ncbi:MAG: EAL domain-containing protein [Gammaproteobacteria bacterium]|nr:EAL domain-containing protein [Gammaproteobacteria bacterium]
MLTNSDLLSQPSDRVALKDEHLVYRACSTAFAQTLGFSSPEEIIGRTDFDLLPAHTAREQLTLDSQTIFSAQADISAIELGPDNVQAMIVRTPVMSSGRQVHGIDIRLLGGPSLNTPRSAVTIDYQLLVNEGLQGSLIFSRHDILFANDNAARVLGFVNADTLVEQGRLHDLFADEQLAELTTAAIRDIEEPVKPQRLMVTAQDRSGQSLQLAARVTYVQWGSARATLLSFVDVAFNTTAKNLGTPALLAAGEQEADKAQRIDDQRYKHFARSAADFFWEMDSRLCFRFVSEETMSVFGIPAEHIVGRTLLQLLEHPANINEDGHWDAHIKLVDDHQPFRDFEFRWAVAGETKVIRYSGLPIFNRSREFLGYRGTARDVTASVRQAETMAYHANHDALTGLMNRRQFENLVNTALEDARSERQTHAMFFMDLDGFKVVNDTCGHEAGDELLRQLAQLFDSLVRKSDLLARLGGDEFGVFLYNCKVAEALKLATQIRHEVENFQFLWEENAFAVGVSVGLVVADDRWENLESLFRAADSACYIAKDEGRNRVVVYREGTGNQSNRNIATHWVEEINSALESNRMRLACQKIQPLHNQPDGLRFEMLLRLEREDGSLVSPTAFLPSAERYGLSAALDERAIDLCLNWLRDNPRLQHSVRHCSINLSSGSFAQPEFAEQLITKIEKSGIPAEKLCFELTETATIANLSSASEFMHRMSEIGCRFSIDDFGSGLSSFAYLRKLPIDFLKIDGLLVKDILDDATDFTMVKAINDICKSMGKRTVAEFIESPRLLNAVRDLGIDFAQGYHVGEPELIKH